MRILVLAGVVSLATSPVLAGEQSQEFEVALINAGIEDAACAGCDVREKPASTGERSNRLIGNALKAYLARRDAWQLERYSASLNDYLAQRDTWQTQRTADALKAYLTRRSAWNTRRALEMHLAQREAWRRRQIASVLEDHFAQRAAWKARKALEVHLAQRESWQVQAALKAHLARRASWQAVGRISTALNAYLARRDKWAKQAGPKRRNYAIPLLRKKRSEFRLSRAAIRSSLGSF